VVKPQPVNPPKKKKATTPLQRKSKVKYFQNTIATDVLEYTPALQRMMTFLDKKRKENCDAIAS
jgi:hypothetical protein